MEAVVDSEEPSPERHHAKRSNDDCGQLGRAVRSTAVRHPWRTTARTSPYAPYGSAIRPVRLGCSHVLDDEEATPPNTHSGAAPTGRPRRALDLDEDPNDDLPIGRLRAGSGAIASGGATA
jgi:hypothetical protein